MAEQPAVYSCPSCGALSKVDPAAGDGSTCGECGYEFKQPVRVAPRHTSGAGIQRFVQRDVVSRRRQVVREKTVLPQEREVTLEVDTIEEEGADRSEDEVISDDGHKKVVRRRKKRRKRAKTRPVLLTTLWIIVVTGAFVLIKGKMRQDDDPSLRPLTKEQLVRRARIGEMQAYIDGHIGECRGILNGFWEAPDVAGKAQFVNAPMRVTPSMYRYWQQHGFFLPTGTVNVVGSNLLAKGSFRAIETIWEDEEGGRFEVTFVRDEGTWKIDWESYVRYSSTRWGVFLSGASQSEGDFRLYMREKQLSDLDGGVHIGVKLYPANYELESRRKGESPTVLVRADSALGARVREVLEGLADKMELGDSVYRSVDPKGMARVRVLLEWREDAEGVPLLHLKDLKAGSWFGEEVVEALGAGRDGGPESGEENGAEKEGGVEEENGVEEEDGVGVDAGGDQ